VSTSVQQGTGQGLRYQRLIALGSGGMANVHLGIALGQAGFKRLVVMKSVRDELLTDPAMRQMFLAEARLSARLNHPNVVQVSEVVEEPAGRYFRYLKAIPVQPPCLICHGTPEMIAPAVRERLSADYPHDRATGYSLGQIRGAVTIKQPR